MIEADVDTAIVAEPLSQHLPEMGYVACRRSYSNGLIAVVCPFVQGHAGPCNFTVTCEEAITITDGWMRGVVTVDVAGVAYRFLSLPFIPAGN